MREIKKGRRKKGLRARKQQIGQAATVLRNKQNRKAAGVDRKSTTRHLEEVHALQAVPSSGTAFTFLEPRVRQGDFLPLRAA